MRGHLWATLVVLMWFGCAENSEPEAGHSTLPPTVAPEAAPVKPGLELPQGMAYEPGTDYHMEVEQAETALPVAGSAQHQLLGRLASPDGKRVLVMRFPDGGEEEVAPAGWYALGAAAVRYGGEIAACFNELVGAPSSLTRGEVPDPRNGVDLVCRVRGADGWGVAMRPKRTEGALWLANLVGHAGGFNVVMFKDLRGTLIGDVLPGEGKFGVLLTADGMGEPEFLEAVGP